MKTYSAKAVANAFLKIADSEGAQISPMKLQKLIYLAHGWSLGLLNSPLISDSIKAWKYGPVIESIYHEFKSFGSSYIKVKATELSLDEKTFQLNSFEPEIDGTDNEANSVIAQVWKVYNQYSGVQLSNITHQPETPWSRCYTNTRNVSIDNDIIKRHYAKLITDRAQV